MSLGVLNSSSCGWKKKDSGYNHDFIFILFFWNTLGMCKKIVCLGIFRVDHNIFF